MSYVRRIGGQTKGLKRRKKNLLGEYGGAVDMSAHKRQEKRAASAAIVNAYIPLSGLVRMEKRMDEIGNKEGRPITRAEYLRRLIEADLGISFGTIKWGRQKGSVLR